MLPSFTYEGRERYFNELINPASDDKYGQEHRIKLTAEAHERLVEGVYPTMFTLIALAALLPAPFNRRGYASRMALAAGVALSVRLAGFAISDAAGYNLHFVPLMYLVPLIVSGVCIAIIAGLRFDRLWQGANLYAAFWSRRLKGGGSPS